MTELISTNPATHEILWRGQPAGPAEIAAAIDSARAALPSWSSLPIAERIRHLESFAGQLAAHRSDLAGAIARETGKPLWESLTEVDSMIAKVPTSIRAFHERRPETRGELAGARALTRYKPHGVVAVFGPFNFPGHLPNGHIVPALLAGNTVVFKPSELTPLVAEKTVALWQAAGLPVGVMNLVQGGRDTGVLLANHPGIDGLFFTGSVEAGLALHRAFAGHPQKILALELGGNNPLIVWNVADLTAAAYLTIQSAFLSAGQRCSCARRLIVEDHHADAFLTRLPDLTQKISVGPHVMRPEPFMGPVITAVQATRLMTVHDDMLAHGARAILPMKALPHLNKPRAEAASDAPGPVPSQSAFLSPGILDVTDQTNRPDVEHFGPLLQIIRVPDFNSAIAEANHTAFGLCAALFSDDPKLYDHFYHHIRAGVVNFNRPTTGASSALPFGGTGLSGNHRPSGYFAADYCSYPVASLEHDRLELPNQLVPGITL